MLCHDRARVDVSKRNMAIKSFRRRVLSAGQYPTLCRTDLEAASQQPSNLLKRE
jgi:hypothetical protein